MPVQRQQLRIISGQWRSRLLHFPDIKGLRPTPDRVRETVFNWLSPIIHGANCLDLFTGSGALGLEAVSRGAEYVTFVDQSPLVVRQLKTNCEQLDAQYAEKWATFYCQNAIDFLTMPSLMVDKPTFDIVFIDPPFYQGLAEKACHLLAQSSLLARSATIYLEVEKRFSTTDLPVTWQVHKQNTSGQLSYFLIQAYPDQYENDEEEI